jgi:glycosyltransferase involved in cell wall biosynthesis
MSASFRVTVSCCGKFHAFSLAGQLQRTGLLHRFLTTDPRAWLEKGLPRTKVWALPAPELLGRVPRRLGVEDDRRWMYRKNRVFDVMVAPLVGEAEVVTCWSGAGRRTLRRAKREGRLAFLERGSTHISHQNDVLVEEFDRFGAPLAPILPEAIQCELDEYALADRIFVPSTFTKRTFQQRGVAAHKVVQLPYGCDISSFRPANEPHDGPFRVVFVGAIGIQKGIWYLLEAMKRLSLPNAELVLVGPVLPEFTAHIAKYTGHFRAVGPKNKAEVAQLLRASSVFVHPSLQEGLSLALREAQASGLPVVATHETGAEDIVADGVDGFIVRSRDVEALMGRLEQLYRDRELRRSMGQAAAERARGWTWDQYGDAMAAAYAAAVRELRG